jgi:hypothetical protein
MQEAGTIDPDKLYGIVEAYDFSAGNVAISDVLAGKLGLASGKNVEKALEVMDEKVEENSSSMLKKDGTVQMTGVLKTVGGSGQQINLGNAEIHCNNGFSGSEIADFTILSNAYKVDGKSYYKTDGIAMAIEFGTSYIDKIGFYVAASGVKDAEITWSAYEILTSRTGLPLTGGTLSGDLAVYKTSGESAIYARRNNTYMDIRVDATEATRLDSLHDDNNWILFYLNSKSTDSIANSIVFGRNINGISNSYSVYGTHNITVSTAAPTGTLAEGAQHQVY